MDDAWNADARRYRWNGKGEAAAVASGGQLQKFADVSDPSAQCCCHAPSPPFGSWAMAGDVPRLAAVRFRSDERGFNFWPLNETRFGAPPRGADRWVQMGNEWWVRAHGQWRTKTFHPIHSRMPFNAIDLHPVRFTLMFWDNGQEWEHRFVQDRWCDPPRALRGGVSGQWKGYTFVRLRQPGEPSSAASSWGEGEPVHRVHPGPEIQPAGASSFDAAGYGAGSTGGKGAADRGRIVANDMLHRRPPVPDLPGDAGHGHLGPSGEPAGSDHRGGGQHGPDGSQQGSSYNGPPERSESESQEHDPHVEPVVQQLPAVGHQRLAMAIFEQMRQQHPAANVPWPRAAEEPPLNGLRHHHQQMGSRVTSGYYTHGDRVRTPTPSDDGMSAPGEAIDRLLHGRFDGGDDAGAASDNGSFDMVEDV